MPLTDASGHTTPHAQFSDTSHRGPVDVGFLSQGTDLSMDIPQTQLVR